MLEYEVGETIQGDIYLQQLIEQVTSTTPTTALGGVVFAYASLVIGHRVGITGLPDREEVAQHVADTQFLSPLALPLGILMVRIGLALLAVHHQDSARAREQYEHLEVMQGNLYFLSVDRVLGLLSHTMGNVDQAAAHFEASLAFCRKGYRPELAWTCCDYADPLLQRNEPGDREKAMSLLDESLAISSELVF